MIGRIGIGLADRSCLQIGDVQPSVDAGEEAEAPEGELRAGDELGYMIFACGISNYSVSEGDHAEVDRGHQTC